MAYEIGSNEMISTLSNVQYCINAFLSKLKLNAIFFIKKYAKSLFLIIIAITFTAETNKMRFMYNSLYLLANLNLVVLHR